MGAAIPVIFVTSHSDSENEHVALSLGAIDFISKPIDIGLCQMRVRNHLTIQDQKTKLARVNHELEAEKKQLAITLKSIADGVISINAAGDVTFINPVAQRLTGYSETEAKIGEKKQTEKSCNKDKNIKGRKDKKRKKK